MFRRVGCLLSTPAVRAGLTLGGYAAIRAYQPSLMDRSRNDQAIVVAGSLTSGYVAGNLLGRAADVVVGSPSRSKSIPAPLLGAAAAAAFTGGLLRQLRSYHADGRPAPPPGNVVFGLMVGSGVATSAWVAAAAERKLAETLARGLASSFGGRGRLWVLASHAAVLGAAAVAGRAAAARMVRAFDAAADRIEPAYAAPPVSPLVSGGPGSVVNYSDLSEAGRRMVSEVAEAEAIKLVMGIERAQDPIRIYVGVDSASNVEARVALAMAEVRRTGALDRSLVVVGSPSGSGYLNYIAVEAAEYLTAGDVATITIQYGKRPSLLSIDRVRLAARQHRALVDAIASEVARRAAEDRPRLVLYGESLGAQTSQDAFREPGVETLTDRFIDAALWVGTPYPTRFRRAVLSRSPRDRRFGRAANIAELDPEARYVFLEHHEDPVTLFTPSIFYQRPAWLGSPSDRPPNVSRTQRWVPGVTFFQTAVDTKNATQVAPGEFEAFGHDYRADLAEFVRAAYAILGISDEQMASVERALRRSEIERARRIGTR
jgi:uncharacterized membrane protein